MNHPNPNDRLARLEGYLDHDPDNLTLLGEVFDLAFRSGAWERAEAHLRHALALAPADPSWQMREGHLLLAQHRWAEAQLALEALALSPALPEEARSSVAHDLAYCLMRDDRPTEGYQVLERWACIEPAAPLDEAIQILWLRLAHRAEKFDEGMAWSKARSAQGTLAPSTAGVAALLALDADDFQSAFEWSEQSLRALGAHAQTEAFVARGSVALGQQDAALARALLNQALQRNAQDGRAWSALAFTDLLEQKFDVARASFERALAAMPGHVGTWHGLGWSCLFQGDLDAALKAFQTALELDRNFGESHGGLAVVQAMRGERAEAEASIERAMRLDKNNLSARYAQAVLSGESADVQAIRRLAVRLLGSRPGAMGGSMLDMIPGLEAAAGTEGDASGGADPGPPPDATLH